MLKKTFKSKLTDPCNLVGLKYFSVYMLDPAYLQLDQF